MVDSPEGWRWTKRVSAESVAKAAGAVPPTTPTRRGDEGKPKSQQKTGK